MKKDKESQHWSIEQNTFESEDIYLETMDEYHRMHELCPKCGCKKYKQTWEVFILNLKKKSVYKDTNKATCQNCEDVHKVDDRICWKEYNDRLILEKNTIYKK